MPRWAVILGLVLLVSWIISNPNGSADTIHHVLTSVGQFLSRMSGGTGSH